MQDVKDFFTKLYGEERDRRMRGVQETMNVESTVLNNSALAIGATLAMLRDHASKCQDLSCPALHHGLEVLKYNCEIARDAAKEMAEALNFAANAYTEIISTLPEEKQ